MMWEGSALVSNSRKSESIAEAVARLDRELRDVVARVSYGGPTASHTHAHSALTGLTSGDDHTQYHTDARALTWHSSLAGSHVTNGNSHNHNGGDGGQIDHGALAGLADDDHPEYAKGLVAYAERTSSTGSVVSTPVPARATLGFPPPVSISTSSTVRKDLSGGNSTRMSPFSRS